jgi:hypothetical protein
MIERVVLFPVYSSIEDNQGECQQYDVTDVVMGVLL